MRNSKIKIWKSLIGTVFKSLRFSALDTDTQSFVKHEMFYFNSSRMPIIAWVILLIEFFNICNVLFFSKSGLATQNNRQYFFMYLLMAVSCIVFFPIHTKLRAGKKGILHRCYICFVLFWGVWNAVLTAMDLRQNQNVTVFVTAMFFLSFLLRLKPCESLSILSVSLLTLFITAGNNIYGGSAINSTIVTIFAAVVSCSRYVNTLEEMGYRQKMILQANHRTAERQKLQFLRNQQTALLNISSERLFLWDKEADKLIFADGQSISKKEKKLLFTWLSSCQSERLRGKIRLYLGEDQPSDYTINVMLQYNHGKIPVGAVGKLTQQTEDIPKPPLQNLIEEDN